MTSELKTITKRDGRTVEFDVTKIAQAIFRAAQTVGGKDEEIAKILAQEVLQTATQADLEKILKLNAPLLRNHYIDSALVLRSIAEPNEYLARRLTTQLRGLELPYGFSSREQKLKLPVMISLKDLELEIDQYSPSGLAFTLKEAAQPIYAPILNQEGRFFSEDINKQTGLPTKTEKKGNRTLWVHYKTGLCGLCLSRNSDIGSSGHDLHSSDNNGLIVVLSTITTEGM